MTRHGRRRRGFTLAEILVAIGLIAVLAAVMVPTIRGRLQDSYENALIGEMSSLANAIGAYRQDVGKYPVTLDYLTTLPTAAADRCGASLTSLERAKWHGPYVTTSIPAGVGSFVFASKDTISLALVPAGGGLAVQVFGPDTATAVSLDLKVDGTANKTTGTLIWSTVTFGAGSDAHVDWVVPYTGGC